MLVTYQQIGEEKSLHKLLFLQKNVFLKINKYSLKNITLPINILNKLFWVTIQILENWFIGGAANIGSL